MNTGLFCVNILRHVAGGGAGWNARVLARDFHARACRLHGNCEAVGWKPHDGVDYGAPGMSYVVCV